MSSSVDFNVRAGAANVAGVAQTWRSNPVKLKRFLARYEHNFADVEDIIQDTLIEALQCIDRYQGRSSLETWLFGIALNVARQHVAASTRRSRLMAHYDEAASDGAEPIDQFCESPESADPLRQAQARQFARRLDAHLESMPLELQKTFEVMFVKELSYVEGARALGIPVGTVRSRLHRIRSLLKPVLM